MQEGFLYKNYTNGGNPTAYNFGAHDLAVSTNTGPEYVTLQNTIKPNQMPSAFGGDFSKLDQIVGELINIFK